MRTRYLISAGSFTAIVCLAIFGVSLMPPGPGVTKANCDRIKKGMTLAEVKAIFGCEATNRVCIELQDETRVYDVPTEFRGYPGGPRGWQGATGGAIVTFDNTERVVEANWESHDYSLAQKIRQWLAFR